MIVKIHQAKTQLSKLIAAALAGEEVVIARGTEPVLCRHFDGRDGADQHIIVRVGDRRMR